MHKQVSIELPELLAATQAEMTKSKATRKNQDLMRDGVITLYLDENDEEQSTDEEVKEEVYVPQCDSERIAKLLQRSQQAILRCQKTI